MDISWISKGQKHGLLYATRVLRADYIMLERDSATIITWIQEALRSPPSHPFLRDVAVFLHDCSSIIIRHVYREANSAANWVASYVVHHSNEVL